MPPKGRRGRGQGRPLSRQDRSRSRAWDAPAWESLPHADLNSSSGEDCAPAAASADPAPEPPPSDDPSDSEEEQAPADVYIEFMISLLLGRSISAREFCVSMYLAGQAGVKGASKYGLKPNLQSSGHYMRLVKEKVPAFTEKPFYDLEVPSVGSDGTGRESHSLPIIPMHEALVEDWDSDPGTRVRLDEMVESGDLPRAYKNHKIVEDHAADGPVLPYGLFIDGVTYSNVDTAIGIWVVNIIAARHMLIGVVRKKLLCACGCAGWCTLRAVFAFLHWSAAALAAGMYPAQRHDRQDFSTDRDRARAACAGEPMRGRACLLYIKGDWAEYAHTFGLAPWGDGTRPCFL